MDAAIGNSPDTVREVLDFWFLTGDARGLSRKEWFSKDPAFDRRIGELFLPTVERAAQGELDSWRDTPSSALALIVLLDQFPRNLFRGAPRAFASDPQALGVARHMLAKGSDRNLLPVERQFVYLPLEHSESLADQEECHRLMLKLKEFPETADLHIWADKHLRIIRRFGRFPHRNAALGRTSTVEEIEFLTLPGSSF
jgi:uncharacterized protein (DUF924 family)